MGHVDLTIGRIRPTFMELSSDEISTSMNWAEAHFDRSDINGSLSKWWPEKRVEDTTRQIVAASLLVYDLSRTEEGTSYRQDSVQIVGQINIISFTYTGISITGIRVFYVNHAFTRYQIALGGLGISRFVL